MKRLIALAMVFALLCSPASAVQIANPWTETTAGALVETLGLSFNPPEAAENIVYRMMESESLAEMQFTLDGAKCIARIMPAAGFVDISGMYYDWSSVEDCEVQWCSGEIRRAAVDGRKIELCLWHDMVPGLMYSVGATVSEDAELDILALANLLFVPAQGDADASCADLLAEALAVCTGYAGTAGSSLKEAIAAAGLLAFAAECADVENLEEIVCSALAVFSDEWMQEFSMNLEGITAILEAAFEDYDSIAGLFDDAGVGERMEELIQIPDVQKKWSALRALLP